MDAIGLFEVALQTRDFTYTGVTPASDGVNVVANAIRPDGYIAQHLGRNETQAKELLAKLVVRP